MRTVYREKRYICGEYMDVFIYPVFETGRPGGKRTKRKPSTEAQKKLNKRHREEKLARLLHANFTPEDLAIHLTYQVQPEDDKAALRDRSNFLRSVKRYAKKHGLGEVKYIGVTEKGKRSGCYHHHIFVNVEKGIDRDILEKLWTKTKSHGYANSRRLQFNEEGLAGLSKYVSKSPIGDQAWTASRNLIDPEPKTRDGRISGRQARELASNIKDNTRFECLYPGYLMSRAEVFHNEVNGGCYLVAHFYTQDGSFISPRRRRNARKTAKTAAARKPEIKRRI